MKTIWKIFAYGGAMVVAADFVGLVAYGVSYGMTGRPEFHNPSVVAQTVFFGGILL